MADQKARPLAPHVQAAIAAGRGVGVQRKVGGVGGSPVVAQRKEAPHVRDMSKQARESGRVGQPKVARHQVGVQRKEAPHVQKMLGREKAAHVREVPGRPAGRDDGRPKSLPAAVQRKEREAEVVWQVTHLVGVQKESLFGDDWQANELPVDIGQLTRGQKILVDDEDVFMSRRGANQERLERRKEDAVQELKNKWLGVKQVEGKKLQNVYIREETIQYTKEKPKEKPIDVQVAENPAEKLFQNLKQIQEAWIKGGKKRRRSVTEVGSKESIKGTELTSGWNWDQYDEGEYVARKLIKPIKREIVGTKQWTLTASYRGEMDGPIAYMILEKRGTDDFEEEGTMYLRWLVGHPEKGGGGKALMDKAKEMFEGSDCTKLKVESAYSAVDWYKKQGFKVEEKGKYVSKKGYGDTVLSIKK